MGGQVTRALVVAVLLTWAAAGTKAPVLYAPFDVPGAFASGFTLPTGQVVTVVRAGTATATYIDANGLVANAAANTARVEKAGLLVEQARTNSALQSETTCVANAVQAPWTLTGAPTCVTNAAVAPDAAASTTADRWTSAVNTDLITQTATTASSTFFSLSQFFNRAVAGVVTLRGTCPVTATVCNCMTSDGRACTATAAGANCTATMTASTTWSRLMAGMTCNAATTTPIISFSPGQIGVSTGTADVWGAQIEVPSTGALTAPQVSSYMATVAASVTRNIDIITTTNPFPAGALQFCGSMIATPVVSTWGEPNGGSFVAIGTTAAANSWRFRKGNFSFLFDTRDAAAASRLNTVSTSTFPTSSPISVTWASAVATAAASAQVVKINESVGAAPTGTGLGTVGAGTVFIGNDSSGSAGSNVFFNVRDVRLYSGTTMCGGGSIFPALFDDDANTVAHVIFRHGALVDRQSNAWVQNGTVPQVPSGAFNIPPGGGPYGGISPYYLLGSGADVLDFPGGVFTISMVATPTSYPGVTSVSLINSDNGTDGWFTSMGPTGAGRFVTRQPAVDQSTTNVGSLGVPFVLCAGRDGTNSMVKLNLGTIVSAPSTYVVPITRPVFIGSFNGGASFPFPGIIHEILATSTAPSDAACIALANTAFARMGITPPP
jgi:hypothetical protein